MILLASGIKYAVMKRVRKVQDPGTSSDPSCVLIARLQEHADAPAAGTKSTPKESC
jgi:hypothetical protein